MTRWTQDFRFFVSRKDANGMIWYMSVPLWVAMLVLLIVLANVITWGVIGLVEAVQYVL